MFVCQMGGGIYLKLLERFSRHLFPRVGRKIVYADNKTMDGISRNRGCRVGLYAFRK